MSLLIVDALQLLDFFFQIDKVLFVLVVARSYFTISLYKQTK